VVSYHHIDDYRAFRPLTEFFLNEEPFDSLEKSEVDLLAEKLRFGLWDLFQEAGWEGDGQISCIFIPPCFVPFSDTYCKVVFHVKQYNNGTSFLAIPNGLDLEVPNEDQ
jgi:hypothetical protein